MNQLAREHLQRRGRRTSARSSPSSSASSSSSTRTSLTLDTYSHVMTDV